MFNYYEGGTSKVVIQPIQNGNAKIENITLISF